MTTTFIQFASGHTFRTSALTIIAPSFAVRQSVSLRVLAGPDNPDAWEPIIHIENLVEIDAEFRAYGDFPEPIVISRERAQQTLQASSDSVSDSQAFLAVAMAMGLKEREVFIDEVTADIRQIFTYHGQWRDAMVSISATSDDEPAPRLSIDSKGETITPDRLAKRIANRTTALRNRLTEAKVLKRSIARNINGALDLLVFLESHKVDFSRDDVFESAGALPTFKWIEHVDPPLIEGNALSQLAAA